MSASTGSPQTTDARRKLVWAGLIVVVFVAVAVAARGLPWREAWLALTRAQPGWVIAGLAANCAMFPLWTSQWRWLTPPAQRPAWGRMLEIIAFTSLTQNVLPLLGGQAAAVGLLVLRGGLSRGAAISVLALDQMLTGLAKLAALGFAAWLTPMPGWMRDGTWSLFGAVAAIVILLVLLAFSTERLRWFAQQKPGLIGRVLANVGAFTQHLSELRRGGGAIWIALGYALGKKALEIAAVLAVQYACGIDLSPASAVLVVAALGLSTLIRTPGNLGVYEATVVLIYSSLGVPPALGLAAAMLQHAVTLVPRLGGGLVVLAGRGPSAALKR
jgi:uncharacterized membrane protein YbhN (UPF0104 family)